MKQPVQFFFTKVSYLYLWRFMELFTILVSAHFLTINEFSIGFFAVLLPYFLMSFFNINMIEKDSSEIKKFCNTLSLVYPLIGVFVGVIIFVISLLYPSLAIPLRLATVIALFISFKKTAEVFYFSRKRHEQIYFFNMISQAVSSILLFVMIYLNQKELSVIVSYIVFNVITTILLWSFFPFKIRSRFYKEHYLNIFSSIKLNLKSDILKNTITYLPFVVVGFFNREYFSYLYLGFVIGYFLYRNLTLFITDLFSTRFVNMSYDMFKYNLVKITEYLSFIIFPVSFINIVLIPQISSIIVNWDGFSEILFMLMLAGLVKAITEITRLVFIVEPKVTAVLRISIVEFSLLIIFMLLLGWLFGSYGIAMAIVLSVLIASIINLLIAQRFIKLDILTVSKNFFYIIFSALISAFSVGILKEWFRITNIFSLIIIFIIGILIYLGLTFFINRGFYKTFVRFMFEVLEE